MSEMEIRTIFSELVNMRNWYKNTTINTTQASEIKRRFEKRELSLGRAIEVLIECGYNVIVEKKPTL